jgi:hypothetical protein
VARVRAVSQVVRVCAVAQVVRAREVSQVVTVRGFGRAGSSVQRKVGGGRWEVGGTVSARLDHIMAQLLLEA